MLRFTIEETPTVKIVRVRGEVDITTAPVFNRELSDALTHGHHVIADLTGVQYIDLSGVRALEAAQQVAREQKRLLVVITPPDPVGRIFDVVQLRHEFTLATTEAEALEACRRVGAGMS